VLRLSSAFVRRWSGVYDERYRGSRDERDEQAIRGWLSARPEPKYLSKPWFVRLCCWKSARQKARYESNPEARVREATGLAYQASDELVKVNTLKALSGVNVAVAATILHFLHPDWFPIFDVRARTTLKKAGMWSRNVSGASDGAWVDYVAVMRRLAKRLRVSLRDLDKALFAYDKWTLPM
jgi:hypothetical protein